MKCLESRVIADTFEPFVMKLRFKIGIIFDVPELRIGQGYGCKSLANAYFFLRSVLITDTFYPFVVKLIFQCSIIVDVMVC